MRKCYLLLMGSSQHFWMDSRDKFFSIMSWGCFTWFSPKKENSESSVELKMQPVTSMLFVLKYSGLLHPQFSSRGRNMMYYVAPRTDCAFLGSRRILNLLVLQLLKVCCDLDSTHLWITGSPHNTSFTPNNIISNWRKYFCDVEEKLMRLDDQNCTFPAQSIWVWIPSHACWRAFLPFL